MLQVGGASTPHTSPMGPSPPCMSSRPPAPVRWRRRALAPPSPTRLRRRSRSRVSAPRDSQRRRARHRAYTVLNAPPPGREFGQHSADHRLNRGTAARYRTENAEGAHCPIRTERPTCNSDRAAPSSRDTSAEQQQAPESKGVRRHHRVEPGGSGAGRGAHC